MPHAQFLHYGPLSDGEEAYGRSCLAMHEQLGLGDRFRFMGRTTDPIGVMRDADVVLMTSISEGLPMSILEAMSQGAPGHLDRRRRRARRGQGLRRGDARPATTTGWRWRSSTLLRNPALAWQLGRLGHERLERIFSGAACIDGYRELLRQHRAARPADRGAGRC